MHSHLYGRIEFYMDETAKVGSMCWALGEAFTWESIAMFDGEIVRTRISATKSRPTRWTIAEPETITANTGPKVAVHVP